MELSKFYETLLDNMSQGIYVLDDCGNYIFVNSSYIRMLNMPKNILLNYNVHDFLQTKQIDVCVSDIVYEKKHRIVMFQDVYDTQGYGRKQIRQLVVSTPLFNSLGKIENVLAMVYPLEMLNSLYYEASQFDIVSTFSSFPSAEVTWDNDSFIAKSPSILNLLKMIQTVSDVDSTILISGESGTGKEVFAKYIHQTGNRKDKPFVVVNCASIPENLLEAELFGYEKGAFTGASSVGKKGLFEEADGGVLFLDEINSLPISLQGKLLRAIETKTINRVGSTRFKHIDFRLVAATNESLLDLVEKKQFRLDLYYRLNVVPISIPPLRERKEDIILLANHFLKHFCYKYNRKKMFSPQTMDNIIQYKWPGNVRELKNFVERAVVVSIGDIIELKNIEYISGDQHHQFHTDILNTMPITNNSTTTEPSCEKMLDEGVTLKDYLEQCEKAYLSHALNRYKTSYKIADALGTSQTSIMRRKTKYNL
ncbi:sigma-54-dependent Fis family transcriptional regulator [Clostridium sp. BSD9I1]|uniref:sigma-54 interaction domain-containing protein n=1 Tax=Clostridium sp. BSD9I1 TaxID=2003589 RepID=UPI001646CB6F|nr:sigma 54-interacting transcriptional regulator [Clostridium sp. BSD9I1]